MRAGIFGAALAAASLGGLVTGACSPGSDAPAVGSAPATTMRLSSPAFVDGGTLPVRFTCDGAGVSPPLRWAGAPAGTAGFAVVMDHQPGPGEFKWYLLVWGLDARTTDLPEAASAVAPESAAASFGGNSVNRKGGYAPPCSQGPGAKAYRFTVFALSGSPTLSPPAAQVDRVTLLAAIEPLVLARASMTVTYERPR